MEKIKVYTTSFINQLIQRLKNKDVIDLYIKGQPPISSNNDTKDTLLEIEQFPKLSIDNSDAENAQILYESLIGIDLTLASDQRLWAWLANAPFAEYMSKRWPVEKQPENKQGEFISRHWFIDTQASTSYVRHGIAMLWWGAYVTYDSIKKDPFELTRELFSMQDYTRILFGTLGRNNNFTHAVLEFVIENPELFKSYKEAKVRFLMRKLNYLGGYKILPSLEVNEIKKLLDQYKKVTEKIVN